MNLSKSIIVFLLALTLLSGVFIALSCKSDEPSPYVPPTSTLTTTSDTLSESTATQTTNGSTMDTNDTNGTDTTGNTDTNDTNDTNGTDTTITADVKTPAAGDVIINEVMWMGSRSNGSNGSTAQSGDEFVELKNTTANILDMSGCSIDALASGSDAVILPEGASILPNGFLVIRNKSDLAFDATESLTGWITAPSNLLNGGEQLVLEDASGTQLDATPTDPWVAGANDDIKTSMERIDATDGTAITNWQDCFEAGTLMNVTYVDDGSFGTRATPGEENSTASDLIAPTITAGLDLLDQVSGTTNTSFDITFSEAVTGVSTTTITCDTCTIDSVTEKTAQTTFTVDVSGLADSTTYTITVSIAADTIEDLFGNDLTGSNTKTITVADPGTEPDTIAPNPPTGLDGTDTLPSLTTTHSLTITFEEAVTGVSNTTVTCTSCTSVTVTNPSGDQKTYKIDLIFPSDGDYTITVSGTGIEDLAGNPLVGCPCSKNISISGSDTTAPTISGGLVDELNLTAGTTTHSFDIVFDEKVTGVSTTTVTCATCTVDSVTNGSGDQKTYTVALSGLANGTSYTITVDKTADTIQDLSGNDYADADNTKTVSVATAVTEGNLIITGIFDGPLTGGIPKMLELYVSGGNITDLSIWGLEKCANGAASTGAPTYMFPAIAATNGDFIYVATEQPMFNTFFGFNPDYTDGTIVNINGDDTILLYKNGTAYDIYGQVGVDGTSTFWDHLDTWAYRNDSTTPPATPAASGMTQADWTFKPVDTNDGDTTNASSANPVPVGTYNP